MKTIRPTSAYIAPEFRVACAAVVGVACGVACALLQGVAEAFGGPSIFPPEVLSIVFYCLMAVVFRNRMGSRRRKRAKPRPTLDDLLA